jgi:hypothetical protein
MEPSATSQPSGGRDTIPPPRTDTGETFFKTPNAPPGRHFEPSSVPDLVGPDFPIPASVAKLFRKLFRRADTPVAR